jgi:hypothetical protein
MSMTTFRESCRFCGSTRHGLSSAGPDICPQCSDAITIAGLQPPEITFDQYRDVIREVADIVGAYLQLRDEKFQSYKIRIHLIVDQRRKGQPISEALLRPLSDGALKAFHAGQSASMVVFTASVPSARSKAPEVKKEPRKSRVEQRTEPLKLWR